MELSTKAKGNLTELKCISAFYELGFSVSIPYGENNRYDFIADINNNLIKIQCKTSREIPGGFVFSTRSTRVNSSGIKYKKYTLDEIDYFATYFDNKCYLVKAGITQSEFKIRYKYPNNGQKKGINISKEYELENVIMNINNIYK